MNMHTTTHDLRLWQHGHDFATRRERHAVRPSAYGKPARDFLPVDINCGC